MTEHFEALGLKPGNDYTPEDIKKAWYAKCLKHHPDRGGDNQTFLLVTHAYKMLTDPSYRYEEASRNQGKRGDLTIRMQVPINFDDWLFGRFFVITYNRIEMDASGTAVVKEGQELVQVTLHLMEMPINTAFIMQGYGLRCGDKVGDLHLTLCPGQHPRFKVEGDDLVTTEQIPLELLLKGGPLEVQTAYGVRTFTLSPGTQPGTRLALPGYGVRNKGNHIVVVNPVYPTKKDLKEKPAWKALDINWEVENRMPPAIDFDSLFIQMGGIHGTTTDR